MMGTCCRGIFLAGAGVSAPVRAEALVQMELWLVDAPVQVLGCREEMALPVALLSSRQCHQTLTTIEGSEQTSRKIASEKVKRR